MSEIAVEFQNVEKTFKKDSVLQSVTFQVMQGEILGLVGPNGCGKTTAVRLMLGFYRATKGTIRVFGCDPFSAFHRVGPRVGVMLELPGLGEELSVNEYLGYFGALFHMTLSDIRTRTKEVLELVGLSDRRNALVNTFSMGMRQRLSLARCLLPRPQMIVLDEPFIAIDLESRNLMLDALSHISRNDGASVFLASQNLREVETISNRVAVIKQGRVIAVDSIAQLRERVAEKRLLVVNLAQNYPRHKLEQFAQCGEYCSATRSLTFDIGDCGNCDTLLAELLKSGFSIHSVIRTSATLENAYFALTKETFE